MRKKATIFTVLLLFLFLAPVLAVRADDDDGSKNLEFELPIEGSSGYASKSLSLTEEPGGKKIATLSPGISFTIKGEKENYFRVKVADSDGDLFGYVEKKYVLINLPDIIPSIVYYDSNSVSSLFKSCGKSLPEITGERLYNVYLYNPRFGRQQYVMPVLYDMAKQVMAAQQEALSEGNSLKIYETFRPHETQTAVSDSLSELMNQNADVYTDIMSWGKTWFICTTVSNHQRGKAMDCSLVKVNGTVKKKMGNYSYTAVTDYAEYKMPTKMHELSTRSATFQYGVGANWKGTPLSKGMKESEGAQLLQKYCTDAGLTPLASEWWHFNSPNSPNDGKGEFMITFCRSEMP